MNNSGECPSRLVADDVCLVYKIAQRMSPGLFEEFMSFISVAEEGSRLTLQRSRDGFSLQTVGAVHRSAPKDLNAKHFEEFMRQLQLTE